jgi:hypothetical protein
MSFEDEGTKLSSAIFNENSLAISQKGILMKKYFDLVALRAHHFP